MKTFNVCLVLLSDRSNLRVEVKAANAVRALDVAQALKPGTFAYQADLVTGRKRISTNK